MKYMIGYLQWDLTEIESLLAIQTKDNYTSFTTKEMMLIYFYYLKKAAEIYQMNGH